METKNNVFYLEFVLENRKDCENFYKLLKEYHKSLRIKQIYQEKKEDTK